MDDLVNKRIAIIPARGGSKRIPKKNIIDFFGKPMISWTIESALETNLFDKVIVSTDNEEIAEISRSFGAEVPFLRNKYMDDFSPVSLATLSTLEQYYEYSGKSYDTVIQLMPNCPLRSGKDIKSQLDFFYKKQEKFSVLSGFNYGMFNPWWAHFLDENNNYKQIFKDFSTSKRSQDLDPLVCPSGATWISSVNNLKKFKSFYSNDYTFYKSDWYKLVDIDSYEDLILAKAAHKILNEES